jgi:CheY-like chemotaxis protein
VMLDIGLPGMDGFEVARKLRSMPELPGVFLIAMTGYGSADSREEGRKAGFDAFLIKPIDLRELQGLLGRLS